MMFIRVACTVGAIVSGATAFVIIEHGQSPLFAVVLVACAIALASIAVSSSGPKCGEFPPMGGHNG